MTATEPQQRIPFRLLLAGLAGLSVIGTGLELAAERHWETWVQRLPWAAVIVTAGLVVLVLLSSRRADFAVRLVAGVVLGLSVFGIYEHVQANYETAPLDFRYTEKWEDMSSLDRWWAAASKAVGPAPPIAAGILAQSVLLLLLATLERPRRS